MIYVYTDGSCKDKEGGSCFIICMDEYMNIFANYSPNTTNNRMEMEAVIDALNFITNNGTQEFNEPITIFSDSQYTVKGVNEWSDNWIKKHFKGVKNSELWKELLSLITLFDNLTLKWTKGHNNNYFNELADLYASSAREARASVQQRNPIPLSQLTNIGQ